jgi:hypothetical protein
MGGMYAELLDGWMSVPPYVSQSSVHNPIVYCECTPVQVLPIKCR